MSGISAIATNIPRYRLRREVIARAWGGASMGGERAVANHDEDSLTLAVGAALELGPTAAGAGAVYCLGEQGFGDAGAALVLERDGAILAEIVGTHSVNDEFLGTWRTHEQCFPKSFPGGFDTKLGYARVLTAAVQGVLAAAGVTVGTVQFPRHGHCLECGDGRGLTAVRLAHRGTLFTFTVDHVHESLDPPVAHGVIDLDDGGRIYLQLTDCDAEALAIDMPLELTFRRPHDAGGFHNYFWKARPA